MVLSFTFLSTSAIAAVDRNSDEWQFVVAPLFLWGSNIDGSAQVGPVSAPLDLAFQDDNFENLSGGFTVHFEAIKHNLALFGEYQYVELDPTTSISNGPDADSEFNISTAEFGAGYVVAKLFGNTEVEPIAGLRYTSHDLVTRVVGRSPHVDVTVDWWDIFAGFRLWTHLTDKWILTTRADIGTGESDLVWNISLKVDYQFKDWGSVFVGYRWMDYDYDDGSGDDRFAYDAMQEGPLAGIAFYW